MPVAVAHRAVRAHRALHEPVDVDIEEASPMISAQPAGAICALWSSTAARQGSPAARQPSARGVAGQALHRPRHALPRPHPGGQPRPDPGGREVRLHQGLQVLDLRDLVDSAGDQPSHGRPVAHDPAAGPPRRAGQQAAAAAPRDESDSGPRSDRRRAGARARHHRGADSRAHRPLARPGQPGPDGRHRRRRRARRLHRRRRGTRRPRRPSRPG